VAIANEILVGRYNRFVQKLLSMKGPAALSQLSGELSPSLAMLNGAETKYLQGWDQFGFSTQTAANAGQLSGIQLRNPTGSNVIAVFERVQGFAALANDQPKYGIIATTTDFTVFTNTRANFDPRGRTNPTLILSRGNLTANFTAPTLWQGAVVFNGDPTVEAIVTEGQEFPLLPGEALQFNGSQLNQAVNYTFKWRERFLEDSERA
jgi:hypothetical protein